MVRIASNDDEQEAREPPIPAWILKKVVPATKGHITSVHVLGDAGKAGAVLFGHDRAYVAERSKLSGVQVFEVEYPDGLLINGSQCPHCGKRVREPVAKRATLADRGTGKKSVPPRTVKARGRKTATTASGSKKSKGSAGAKRTTRTPTKAPGTKAKKTAKTGAKKGRAGRASKSNRR